MNFYACIIGSEILNGRRVDKHFEFVKSELGIYGHELFASFIIKDDAKLIKKVYELIKNDKDSVLFSFGGIGATPDDLTRDIAADVFTSKPLVRHKKFEQDIIDRFKDDAYPHRVHMADLPDGANLLFNPINNMSGFYLDERFFFTPGFPQMSHPMISEAIKRFFGKEVKKYRLTLVAQTSENTLIHLMQKMPPDIEFSSLPMLKDSGVSVEISVASKDENLTRECFDIFIEFLNSSNISYQII